jgi:amino acid adenylation domain-containing protein
LLPPASGSPGESRLPEPDRLLLHHYLIDTAGRSGQSVAIAESGRTVSFEELLNNALAIAATLQQRGLQKGDRVALILSKNADAITALFATLLAGAIYVPIQPRWPAERIASTLEDCGAHFVFAESAEGPPSITNAHSKETIRWEEALSHGTAGFRAPAVSPQDTAFILFTSGSTGRPKGVAISHSAAAAFVNWSAREFRIGPEDRIACPSPLSFDLSTFDIFNMARCGATCVIAPEQNAWFPRFLTALLDEERITIWYSVPSILTGMLNEGGLARRAYPALRAILFAGEVFASSNVVRLQAAVPNAALYNLYGPTETNVVTWYQVPPQFDDSRPVPIGRPCPYARVELDAAGEGEGELLVAGDSLMTGYWNRPEETARVFTERSEAARYYRTGDRVATAPDGNLLFRGRLDRQVKRHGFRIELGEIEAALSRHAAILESAVLSHQNAGETAIIAFVRTANTGSLSQTALRSHCAQVLPSYMLPDRILFLPAIPKGSRGKTDYAALRKMLSRE